MSRNTYNVYLSTEEAQVLVEALEKLSEQYKDETSSKINTGIARACDDPMLVSQTQYTVQQYVSTVVLHEGLKGKLMHIAAQYGDG